MFGLLAALNCLTKPNDTRQKLNYENYIRTGQSLPTNKIYRESSLDRQTRKDLAVKRYKEHIQQQVKFVRLMKKLLIKIDRDSSDQIIDQEYENMRNKVAQLEIKVEKAARKNNINYEDMNNMSKPDDDIDIELEQIIRNAIQNGNTDLSSDDKYQPDAQAYGDNIHLQTNFDLLNNFGQYQNGCTKEKIDLSQKIEK